MPSDDTDYIKMEKEKKSVFYGDGHSIKCIWIRECIYIVSIYNEGQK